MRAGALAALALAALGCAIPGLPDDAAAPPPPPKPPLELASAPAAGSLWRGESSRRFLSFEARAKQVGDLLTVLIAENAAAENQSSTEVDRTESISSFLASDLPLRSLITRPVIGLLNLLGFSNNPIDRDSTEDLNVIDATTTSSHEGEGTVTREATFTTTIACLVTGVSDSGLLRIEGERQIKLGHDTQVIRVAGWVRPEDVAIENTVSSSLIADARIEYVGAGAIHEAERMPWGMRVMNALLPF
jgi:flagellar L-ring protein precursor FlgH